MFEWITRTIAELGYGGVVLLMFLENVFPPIPSELIMPLVGFEAAKGTFNLWLAIGAGVLGTLLGAFPWYWLGQAFGLERLRWLARRYGRVITLSEDDLDAALAWFQRYGGVAVLLCRLAPAVRTVISTPAGLARMNMAAFLAFTAVGTALWVGLLTYAGVVMQENFALIEDYVDPVSKLVVALVVAIYLYRVATFKPSRRA